MRTLIAVLLAATLAPGAALAAEEREGYVVTPGEMLDVYGTYHLDTGGILRISREQRRYWAELSNVGRFEIRPVGSIVFVSREKGLRLAFTPVPFTTDVLITRLAPS